MSLLDGFLSLASRTNKVGAQGTDFETIGDPVPELKLEMPDEDLLSLAQTWTRKWDQYIPAIKRIQDECEAYWLGKQYNFNTDEDRALSDNVIFESLETVLPIATRPKADPIVESNGDDGSKEVAERVRKMIIYLVDHLNYNTHLKQMARYWALYLLGAMKVGWSMKENEITLRAIRPQKLILDPDCTIEAGVYTGRYIGEYVDDVASDLIVRFPSCKEHITTRVNGNMGTKITYIMWSTNEYIFWQLDQKILGKTKNPHWNYDTEETVEEMDEYGQVMPRTQKIPGRNHFATPRMPYIFLSIFNLGTQPHDNTSLVHQNIRLQDLVNKRLAQIDKNADNANGGVAVSGDAFTEAQAQKVAKAKRKGGTVWVPSGSVDAAIKTLDGQQLPQFVYESLLDYRNEMRNIFGTRGSTPQGTMNEQTVGGKNIIRSQDTDRIGGGISTYLEQVSDQVFNWFVQLMYVYYDEPHTGTIIGRERAADFISIQSSDLVGKLTVSVKEGSMIPKDPASQRGEAITLWQMNGIDPITFFDRLEFPNPRESAKQLYQWMVDPVQLFPELAAQQAQEMALQDQIKAEEQAMMGEQEMQKGNIAHQQKLEQIAAQGALKANQTKK